MTDQTLFHPALVRAETGPLIRLGIPLMVGLAAALLIGVIDTIMISPVISVQVSQAHGADDPRRVAVALRSGLMLSLLSGGAGLALMLMVFPLLRPLGQPDEVLDILFPYWASMAVWIIPFTLFFALKSLFDAVDPDAPGVFDAGIGPGRGWR